jgi:radical SAM protein with 4Fe4S-binding SPASM domain
MKNCNKHDSKVGYLAVSDLGGDYLSCPYCGKHDAYSTFGVSLKNVDKYKELSSKIESTIYNDNNDNDYWFNYCHECKLTFVCGCKCDRDLAHNAHIISKYMFNGDIYEGQPFYESIDEWLELSDKVTVLEWCCPNNGKKNCSLKDIKD